MSERCSKWIYAGSWLGHQCRHNDKVERDGKWYCGIHDPVRVAEKMKARDAKWDAKWKKQERQWKWLDAAHDLCAGVSTKTLIELGKGWLVKHLAEAEKENL